MIKGCQKKIIHLRNTESPFFEEAYFVLKEDLSPKPAEDDIIKEAMRIAEKTKPQSKKKRGAVIDRLSFIILGAGGISLLLGITMLIVCFLTT
ncbi:MAG: hypothetical protein IKL24_04895 [Clostridia bacterium]|nr:hypothetical protein [Clostridia bacterium]